MHHRREICAHRIVRQVVDIRPGGESLISGAMQ
jgi:hypothetical protein